MKIKHLLLCILFLLSAAALTQAATINAFSPSYNDVSSAIASARDGDTVQIPAGSATWSSTLNVGSKGIAIIGAGSDNTIITNAVNGANPTVRTDGPLFKWSNTGTKLCRLSGIRVNSNFNHEGIVWLTGPILKIRVDNCYFDRGTVFFTNMYGNNATGPVYGVVDHCTFYNMGRHGMYFANDTRSGESASGATRVGQTVWDQFTSGDHSVAGSDQMLYFEDNQVHYDTNSPQTDATLYGYQGGRACLRYNTFDGFALNYIDAHGDEISSGVWSTFFYEIYHNTFTVGNFSDVAHDSQGKDDYDRGGMQIIHDNTWIGGRIPLRMTKYYPNDVRTVKNTYFWNNTWNGKTNQANMVSVGNDGTATDSNTVIQENRDYFLRAPAAAQGDIWGDYTPYTYPHPLVSGGGPSPPPRRHPLPLLHRHQHQHRCALLFHLLWVIASRPRTIN